MIPQATELTFTLDMQYLSTSALFIQTLMKTPTIFLLAMSLYLLLRFGSSFCMLGWPVTGVGVPLAEESLCSHSRTPEYWQLSLFIGFKIGVGQGHPCFSLRVCPISWFQFVASVGSSAPITVLAIRGTISWNLQGERSFSVKPQLLDDWSQGF